MLLDRKVNVLWVMNAAAVAATATWFISLGLVFTDKTETSAIVKGLLASHEAAIKRIAPRARSRPLGPQQRLAAMDATRVYYATYVALLALANAEAGDDRCHFEKCCAELPDDQALGRVFARHPAAVSWIRANHAYLWATILAQQVVIHVRARRSLTEVFGQARVAR